MESQYNMLILAVRPFPLTALCQQKKRVGVRTCANENCGVQAGTSEKYTLCRSSVPRSPTEDRESINLQSRANYVLKLSCKCLGELFDTEFCLRHRLKARRIKFPEQAVCEVSILVVKPVKKHMWSRDAYIVII